MQVTVRQAALQVGVSRQTLFRKIQQGEVTATIAHDGTKQIDTSELLRVFGSLQRETVTAATARDSGRQPHATDAPLALQLEIMQLKSDLVTKSALLEISNERLAELKGQVVEVKSDRDRLLGLLERQTRLLSAPVKPARKPATKPKKKGA
jgi:transposase-like protein